MIDLPGRLVLLGHPVAHSLSPRFQAAALRSAGIELEYEAVDVAPDDLAKMAHLLLRGLSAAVRRKPAARVTATKTFQMSWLNLLKSP